MEDDYPSYKELFQELKVKRQEIKGLMHKHNIFGWPDEAEFPTWMAQETRLTPLGRERLTQLGKDVVHIKKLMTLRLDRKKI